MANSRLRRARASLPTGYQFGDAGPLRAKMTEFPLSGRARKGLLQVGAKTVADVMAISDAELLCVKNFGRKSLREVRAVVAGVRAVVAADHLKERVRG